MRLPSFICRLLGLEPDECRRCGGRGGIRIKGGYITCPACGGTGKK